MGGQDGNASEARYPWKLLVPSCCIGISVAGLLIYTAANAVELYHYSREEQRNEWAEKAVKTWADMGEMAPTAGPGLEVALSKPIAAFDYIRSDNYLYKYLLGTYNHHNAEVLVGAACFALLAAAHLHLVFKMTFRWKSFLAVESGWTADHGARGRSFAARAAAGFRRAFWWVSEDLWENGQMALTMLLGV